MTYSEEVLGSRIHQAGCPWLYTWDCTEQLGELHGEDAEAYDLLMALVRRAYEHGLPPTENNNDPSRKWPTHRAPVGEFVPTLPDHGFTDQRPMPWAGELYAESHDQETLFRLYFIEARQEHGVATDEVVGCALGRKPANDDSFDPRTQTQEICDAMHLGVEQCLNRKTSWRLWNAA